MKKTKIVIFKISFILVFSSLFFGGCISLTKELPAYKTYSLEYKKDNTSSKYFDKTIQVLEPKALESINSEAITYSKDDFSKEKYALNRWSDKPSKMLQRTIASYLTSKNSYKYITSSNIKVKSDFKIVSQLVDFNHTFTKNSSYADFSIRVYLINNHNEKVFFKSFTYTKRTSTNNAKGLVKTMNEVNNIFLSDLNTFIQSVLNK